MGTTAEALTSALTPLLDELGLSIYDVELASSLVRVAVTKSGGVTLDELASANSAISSYFDEHEPFERRYTLEVTSPGIERSLKKPAQFVTAVGEELRVKTIGDVVEGRRVEGILVAADEAGIVVSTPAGDEIRLGYNQIEKARTHFAWGAQAKPSPSRAGAPRGRRRASQPARERTITP
jgi:ribosome maturation factor RimP